MRRSFSAVAQIIENDNQTQLPDGRWQVAWEKDRPRLNER